MSVMFECSRAYSPHLGEILYIKENNMRRRSEDPTNQSTIPVLDSADNPLMPTRPSRARRLIRQGRAEKSHGARACSASGCWTWTQTTTT